MDYREHFELTHNKGTANENTQHYKTTKAGTVFHEETPDDLVRKIETLIVTGDRIRLDYGNVETGESWHEQYDVTGRIGRSSGFHDRHWPILVHNRRSFGGGIILDDCIIGIDYANKQNGGAIYRRRVEVVK